MWRIRLFFENVGWKPVAIAAVVLMALVGAAVAFAVLSGGDEQSAHRRDRVRCPAACPSRARTSTT